MGKKMDKDTNAVNYFEIAVTDIKRATKFYETIFEITLRSGEWMGMKMAMFPTDGINLTGKRAIVTGAQRVGRDAIAINLRAISADVTSKTVTKP